MNTKKSLAANKTGGGTCKHQATLLLTGTIDPLSFNRDSSKPKINVALDNTLERLAQYENAISRYITETYFTDIVFVENSGYPFPTEKYEKLAAEHGKRFEFLYRELSDDEIAIMQDRGKSWGEADLIDYAMCNSQLIAETDVIYKCTGRVFLKNSNDLIKKAHNESEFIKWRTLDWCKTDFFKVLKEDYFTYLQSVKDEVSDHKFTGVHSNDNLCIERCYFLKIKNSNMKVKNHRVYPNLDGITASSNTPYNKKWWKRMIYNILPDCMRGQWKIK